MLQSMSELPWLWLAFALIGYNLARNMLRSLNIAVRGWPPPYLDADGDYKRNEKEVEDEE